MSVIKDVKTGKELKEAYIALCDACITSVLIGSDDEVVRIVGVYREAGMVSGDLLHYSKFMSNGLGYINLVNKIIEKRIDKEEAIQVFKDMIDIATETYNEETGDFVVTNLDEEEKAAIIHNTMIEAEETLGDDATVEDISNFVDERLTEQREVLERMGAGIEPGPDCKKPPLPKDNAKDTPDYKEIFKTIAYGAGAVCAVAAALWAGAAAVTAIREIGSGDIIINE